MIISGVTTSGCVRATALDSLQHNLLTTVVENCVGDRSNDAHQSNLVDLKEEGSAKVLARYDRQRAVTISANVNENYSLFEAIEYLENIMSEVAPTNQITWKGESEEIKETTNELYIIFALGLLTAYLVMAATFNSFIHPFIIMLTVPLAVFGGLVFILFLNSSINIFSQIALVILIGISTKNSILIVDYANQIRTTGKDLVSSVKEASSLRFRPIMMTSISTMIAMMPLVIGNIGPGAGVNGGSIVSEGSLAKIKNIFTISFYGYCLRLLVSSFDYSFYVALVVDDSISS